MSSYPVYRPEKYSALSQNYKSSHYNSPIKTSLHTSHPQPHTHYRSISPHVTQKTTIKNEVIKGNSRIEYIPVEKKVIDYADQPHYSIIPRKRLITDYKEQVKVQMVPREVSVIDYYAIEHLRQYIPQYIPEKTIDYVPKERKNFKQQFIPVERQIVHLPEHSHHEEESRYLGVRPPAGPKRYENINESELAYWEREYGYRQGESIETLNRKIYEKTMREKEQYFRRYEMQNSSPSYLANSTNNKYAVKTQYPTFSSSYYPKGSHSVAYSQI